MAGVKREIVNPFATSELRLPESCVADVRRFTATFSQEESQSAPDADKTPFRRYVDVWWVGMAIGVAQERLIEDPAGGWHKFIDGVILQSDPWRVVHMQMLGLAWFKDPSVLGDPGRIIARANAHAAYGVPKVLDALSGAPVPMFELSHYLREMCKPDEGTES